MDMDEKNRQVKTKANTIDILIQARPLDQFKAYELEGPSLPNSKAQIKRYSRNHVPAFPGNTPVLKLKI
jgi:hypothetical protein